MKMFAQRSGGGLGGLCFYENFRTKKQRGFERTVLLWDFRTVKQRGFDGVLACIGCSCFVCWCVFVLLGCGAPDSGAAVVGAFSGDTFLC